MIAQEYLYDARALIDDFNTGGTINSATDPDMQELTLNGLRFLNMGVGEIYEDSRSFKEVSIVNKIIPNLLGDLNQFDIVDFIGEDQPYPINGNGVVGAKSYFFTLDCDATVLIQEYNGTWNTLETLNLTPTEETDYKGTITPTDSSYPIQLVFSGTTHYRHFNRCLYSYPFKADKIPDFKPWVEYEMPDDFGELDKIVKQYPQRQYASDADYKWEGRKTLVVNYFFEGTLKVIYKPIPVTISDINDEVEVYNPTAQQFLRFFVAAKLATTENPDLVNFFEGKANEMKFEALKGQPASEEKITDVFLGGMYG